MPRPRTVNKKIPDLPRGMRKVDGIWYWRGTDGLTKEIEAKLRAAGIKVSCGTTPVQARLWWQKHVSPALIAVPDDDVVGTVEEIIRKYEADADSDVAAQELLHHEDVKVTKRVYRRKVPVGTPLPSAIGGRGEG